MNLRLRHNLHQWYAGTIKIDPRAVLEVKAFRHVFLEMNTHQMHFLVRRHDVFLRVLRIGEIV